MIIDNGLCAAAILIVGSIYASGANLMHGRQYTIIVMIYLFLTAFSSSAAITRRIYVTEIQPITTRAAASSLALRVRSHY